MKTASRVHLIMEQFWVLSHIRKLEQYKRKNRGCQNETSVPCPSGPSSHLLLGVYHFVHICLLDTIILVESKVGCQGYSSFVILIVICSKKQKWYQTESDCSLNYAVRYYLFVFARFFLCCHSMQVVGTKQTQRTLILWLEVSLS